MKAWRNLSKWTSEISSLCWSAIRTLWYFCWKERILGWWSSCKTRHWHCASNLFFTFRNRSPCTILHGVSTCSTLIRRVKKYLIRYLWWIDCCSWIAKNVSLCPRQIPCIRSGLGSTWIEDLERLLADWERVIIFHCQSARYLEILWILSLSHSFLQLLYLWSELLYRSVTFSQFISGEFVNSRLLGSTSWILLICTLSRWGNSSCLACSFRGSPLPWLVQKNSQRLESSCLWRSRTELSRKSALHSYFRTSDFASASIYFLCSSRNDFIEFSGLENLNWGSLFPWTCWCSEEHSSLSESVTWLDFLLLENNATGFSRTLRNWRRTWHQVFSYRVINSWSVRTYPSLLEVQWWSQQSTNLLVIQIRSRRGVAMLSAES